MSETISLPAIGELADDSGMVVLSATSDGRFHVGAHGVTAIVATGDR